MAKDARDIAYRARVDRYERRHERGLRRLERRLDAVREIEEKRSRQAEKARQRGAARKVQTKRARQADEARRRAAAIAAAIEGLRAAAAVAEALGAPVPDTLDAMAPDATAPRAATAPEAGDPVGVVDAAATAIAGPRGYCLRERQSVELAGAKAVIMRNGRAGIEGTCPGCGTRIVRPGRL
jgi:membrane protein involved in colicin uptake